MEASVSRKEATFTFSDNVGISGYGVNQSNTEEPTYVETNNTSVTWTASSACTYYVWVKDKAGNKSNASFEVSKLAFCAYDIGKVWTYGYTGGVQSFSVPCSGTYKIESYGTQSGNHGSLSGGNGGKVTATFLFDKNEALTITTGGQNGYNGCCSATNYGVGCGAGAQCGTSGSYTAAVYTNVKQYILSVHPNWANQVVWVYGTSKGHQNYSINGNQVIVPTTVTINNETWYLENGMSVWYDGTSRFTNNSCQLKIYYNGSASWLGNAFFEGFNNQDYDYGWKTNGVTNVYQMVRTKTSDEVKVPSSGGSNYVNTTYGSSTSLETGIQSGTGYVNIILISINN